MYNNNNNFFFSRYSHAASAHIRVSNKPHRCIHAHQGTRKKKEKEKEKEKEKNGAYTHIKA